MRRITLNDNFYPEGTSIIVKQVGHAVLTVNLKEREPEEYLITFPKLRIEGLWYGSPYIELTETTNIVGSNGWTTLVCQSYWLSRHPYTFCGHRSNTKGKVIFLGNHTPLRQLYHRRLRHTWIHTLSKALGMECRT